MSEDDLGLLFDDVLSDEALAELLKWMPSQDDSTANASTDTQNVPVLSTSLDPDGPQDHIKLDNQFVNEAPVPTMSFHQLEEEFKETIDASFHAMTTRRRRIDYDTGVVDLEILKKPKTVCGTPLPNGHWCTRKLGHLGICYS